jgi:hypothetical protein
MKGAHKIANCNKNSNIENYFGFWKYKSTALKSIWLQNTLEYSSAQCNTNDTILRSHWNTYFKYM